jgi:hypothetical protein
LAPAWAMRLKRETAMAGPSLTEEEPGAQAATVRSWVRAITEPGLARWSNSSNRSSASSGVRSLEV